MSDSLFQVTGVASGIAWDEIISSTLEAARKPAEQWESKIDTLEYKRTLYQELSSTLYTLRGSLTKLKLESTYKKKAAEFVVHEPVGGDSNSVVKATVNADAEISRWTIRVDQLATAQRHISKRVDDPSGQLGITGSFRIQVGVASTVLEIEATDTIRTINQKINQLRDQEGNQIAVTATLIDNRLVIESAFTGRYNEDKSQGDTLSIADAIKVDVDPNDSSKGQYALMYLPRSADGTYPAELYELKIYGSGNYFREGKDYIYNAEEGLITWLPGGARPSDTDVVETVYMMDVKMAATTNTIPSGTYAGLTYDVMPTSNSGIVLDIDTNPDAYAVYNNSGKKLTYGTDYTFALANGTTPVVVWLDPASQPSGTYTLRVGADVEYSVNNYQFYMAEDTNRAIGLRGNNGDFASSDYDLLPTGLNGKTYTINSNKTYEIVSLDGKTTYVQGVDFKIAQYTDSKNKTHQVIEWLSTGSRPADGESYIFKAAGDIQTSSDSILNQLGFTTISYDENNELTWAYDQYQAAQDALLNVNGVDIVRYQNEISDDEGNAIIANVKLELMGVGYVTMDVTQDVSEAVEAMKTFVEAYNTVMDWINTKLEEKYNANTVSDDDDYLQSILSESRGSTVFGPLHGDSLLWSIKNQMRTNISNPISSLSNTLRSKKYVHTNTALSMQGSFYINAGGKVARIDISTNDSLEDIQNKLNYATSINNGDNKNHLSNKDMGLNVEIIDGQLVIKTTTGSKNSGTIGGSTKREKDTAYDLIDFVPNLDSSSAINGDLVITSGKTSYTRGVDYKLETVGNSSGILESRIVWLEGGKSPTTGSTYNVAYTYNPTAVAYEFIPYSGDLSSLNLHYDTSNIQLSTLGIATESTNYGKSGVLEFDEDKFFEAIKDDAQLVTNVMTQFMRDLDSYIGNLVDSSNIIIGGQVVTKGRIAAALNSIDSEVASLQQQIDKLETQLAAKQTALYKQYSNMEQAIQTMNAQMSSISQYFNQSSSG